MDNPTKENIQQSLTALEDVMAKTRKAIASNYANPLLILWGVIWVAAYTASYFYIKYAGHIFTSLDVIGAIATFLIIRNINNKSPIKSQVSLNESRRLLWFWLLLFVYAFIWLQISAPFNGRQLNAVFATAAMFGYIAIGLWFNSFFMVWLGLAVTAMTLIGFYFLASFYCLWMAVTGGLAILVTGLYIRFRWR